jgi:dipeptidyl-peptidase-3
LDPLGKKGAWQVSIAYIDPQLNRVMQKLAEQKAYFEEKMPWPEQFKIRGDVKPPRVDVHMVVHQSGFLQAMTIAGINLPNHQGIRETLGSKNMILQNNLESSDQARSSAFEAEFYLPENRQLNAKWGAEPARLMTVLHEVIGHGSGKMRDGLTYSDLGTNYGALEENRADLCAIEHVDDPLILELKYVMLARKIDGAFLSLRTTASDGINQEHQQAHTMTLNWLRFGPQPLFKWEKENRLANISQANLDWLRERLANTKLPDNQGFGVALEKQNGKHYLVIKDRQLALQGSTILLGLLQMAKGTGDRPLTDALFANYVTSEQLLTEFFGPKSKNGPRRGGLRDELKKRAAGLRIANHRAFVSPTLVAVKNKRGSIERIELDYPQNVDDFLRQQLKYSQLAAAED